VEDPRGRYEIFDAMAFEISESGMSAATPNILLVGEHVELNPVMAFRLQAIVRRKSGAMYGFEFAGLIEQQREHIRKQCEKLPLFSSMLDV
jgi:PilZ domain